MASLVDLVNSITFDAQALPLSVPATVTPPNSSAITTTGVWSVPTLPDTPAAAAFNRGEIRRVMALKRADVPTVPRGTLISAPEKPGGTASTWRVDGIELVEADHRKVIVIPEPS